MTDSLLIFTFSPVQSFIAEARRAADLYTGSQILVELSRAAASAIGWEKIIYPASREDIPNRLVAKIPDDAERVANRAKTALLKVWNEIANSAIGPKSDFAALVPSHDPVWKAIWERQIAAEYLWEIFWASVEISDGAYQAAYLNAERMLLARKFNRSFAQVEEPGYPDSLSGKRSALHTSQKDGKRFWESESIARSKLVPVQIRPNGQERLDAFGLVKRFSYISTQKKVEPFKHFPSTSSIASADFLEAVNELPALMGYQRAITALLPDYKYEVRERGKSHWLFDGDLFYPETLTTQRLENDYGLTLNGNKHLLTDANKQLSQLYAAAREVKKSQKDNIAFRSRPSPYYAIIKLDGDDMGDHIKECQTATEHETFSRQIANFSQEVQEIVRRNLGAVIYNGGDDVLAMTPLSTAFKTAGELAKAFYKTTEGKVTASAGIAITHHTSPLGAALEAARKAEGLAKDVDGKDAVCVYLLKRSGEPVQMVTHWNDEAGLLSVLAGHFASGSLASKFVYEVITDAYAGSGLVLEAQKALLKRLLKRHCDKANQAELLTKLEPWLGKIGLAELGKWLALARFVAQGGDE